MAEGFDLSKIVPGVSKLNILPGQEQIEYIPFEKLLPDPNNGYSMDDVEDLARNIELVGLQQPLRVYPAAKEGCFMINSGHRRRAAVGILIKDGSEMFASGVPCIVDRTEDSPALREFKLLAANMDNRKLTDADLSQQLERLQDVLRRLEDEGFKITGRARDWVSELSGVSRSKIARLQAIRNNLEPSLLSAFDKGVINTAVAYELQKLPHDFQERLFRVCKSLNMYDVERAREWYEKGRRWEPQQTCPDGKPCRRGDTFLRHDIEHPHSSCFGKKCCLECSEGRREYYPCDRRCSKCEAQREDERDKKKELEAQHREREWNKLKAQTSVSAVRIVKAADAADLSDDVRVKTGRWGNSYSIGQIREMAKGAFPPDFSAYQNPFSPDSLTEQLPDLCNKLLCSADYLLGRTDELNPPLIAPPEPSKAEPTAEKTDSIPWRFAPHDPPKKEGTKAICLYRGHPKACWSIIFCIYKKGQFRSEEYGIKVDGVEWWVPYVEPEEVSLDGES